ncbi:MAG TPA: hypothetical protein VF623_03105, partial [Segetibacter sp.]
MIITLKLLIVLNVGINIAAFCDFTDRTIAQSYCIALEFSIKYCVQSSFSTIKYLVKKALLNFLKRPTFIKFTIQIKTVLAITMETLHPNYSTSKSVEEEFA